MLEYLTADNDRPICGLRTRFGAAFNLLHTNAHGNFQFYNWHITMNMVQSTCLQTRMSPSTYCKVKQEIWILTVLLYLVFPLLFQFTAGSMVSWPGDCDTRDHLGRTGLSTDSPPLHPLTLALQSNPSLAFTFSLSLDVLNFWRGGPYTVAHTSTLPVG